MYLMLYQNILNTEGSCRVSLLIPLLPLQPRHPSTLWFSHAKCVPHIHFFLMWFEQKAFCFQLMWDNNETKVIAQTCKDQF